MIIQKGYTAPVMLGPEHYVTHKRLKSGMNAEPDKYSAINTSRSSGYATADNCHPWIWHSSQRAVHRSSSQSPLLL